jgi:hypothetical protein
MTLSEKLAKNLKYFTSNPKKRCSKDYNCKYSGKTLGIKTKGCFVGALMTPKQREWADINHIGGVYILIKRSKLFDFKLPNIITENEKIMSDFQSLHDKTVNWDENGLNDNGLTTLKAIIRDHNLDPKPFEII